MSASLGPALDATAFQLLAAIDEYEADSSALVAAWPDLELYAMASAQIERIRLYSAPIPELRVHWVELLIAHAELIHHLWRAHYASRDGEGDDFAALRQRHAEAVASMRRRCQRLLSARDPSTAQG
jgi:hypothetical protein